MSDVATLRVPPHSIEAEQALIGGILSNPGRLPDIELEAGAFYRREHRLLWGAMQALRESEQPVDALAVADWLAQRGQTQEAGGIEYLVDLQTNYAHAGNVEHYARIVRERATERQMILVGHALADMGYNAEGRTVAERLAEAQGKLAEIDTAESAGPQPITGLLKEAAAELDRRQACKGQMQGLATGFELVDQRTWGLMPGDLIVLAGRPGSGKTALAGNIAENVALNGGLVVFFSLEMSAGQLTMRMLSSQARVPANLMRSAKLEADHWDNLLSAAAKLKGRPLYVDDDPGVTSMQILGRTRKLAAKLRQAPALVVVDYLQLLADSGEGVERITKISRRLKLAAKALGCPLIALSQLNREVDKRPDKRPRMSDLRESGSIEQDADIIWFLYRDEYYNPDTQRKGIADLITAKFRNGETGEDALAVNLGIFRFDNLEYGGARHGGHFEA